MLAGLVIALVLCIFVFVALVWALICVIASCLAEAKAPSYRLTHPGSGNQIDVGSSVDGSDEADGTSYYVVNGNVRLE
jgi:hypothetical protein